MYELIKLNYDNSDRPTVSGRELHEALEVNTRYNDWFKRMCEYGFTENIDYIAITQKRVTAQGNEVEYTNHQLTIDMAKELCMIQRTDKGKECRQYFIKVEEAWNSPEAIMSRALKLADKHLNDAKLQIAHLETVVAKQAEEFQLTVAIKDQQIAEMKPKASYFDAVMQCKDAIPITIIAKDYGWSASKLNQFLKKKGVQYNLHGVWLLYQKYSNCGYTVSKPNVYTDSLGVQHTRMHTYWLQKGRLFIYDLLKADGILPIIERVDTISVDDLQPYPYPYGRKK